MTLESMDDEEIRINEPAVWRVVGDAWGAKEEEAVSQIVVVYVVTEDAMELPNCNVLGGDWTLFHVNEVKFVGRLPFTIPTDATEQRLDKQLTLSCSECGNLLEEEDVQLNRDVCFNCSLYEQD